MRLPSTVFAVARYALAVTAIAGTVVLMSAPKNNHLTVHDKAYYADAATVNFVRPGLTIKIVSVDVANDGTVKSRYKITDPKGLPLDRDGITTPGAVSVSLLAAYIPKGQTQYQAYTTRVQGPSPITKATATQAGADSGGTHDKVADGEYVYTFKTKLPAGFDKTATHSVGAYGSRNLTEFDMGTDYASDVYTFVPDGSKVAVTRDVIRDKSCNKCHSDLAFHGGSRRGMAMCVLCHTPYTNGNVANVDPDTGNTIDMVQMTHRIHAGEELPSVQEGKPYRIVGNAQAVSDWSSVVFPANARNCQFCHEQNTGAAQKDAFLKPNRAACGSCHDNVNFATGANHANLPQASDNACAQCHVPRGELEFDVSILGAHTIETQSPSRPGVVVDILKVTDGVKGKKPTVTFTLRDSKGNGIPLASMKTSPNRVGLVLAGPSIDYGYTSFGSDVTTAGYVAEDASNGTCDAGGTCTYTFLHGIPADAWGTYSIGIEARRGQVINPGTKKEVSTEYGANNKVMNFSVDGSPVSARRKIVDVAKCNNCHGFLSLHGENRNQIEQCVLCHNPSETDKGRRGSATVAADKAAPAQSVNFALMIHKIHTGEGMQETGNTYTVVGFGGSHNDFSEVRYPAFTKQGHPGAEGTKNCAMCHVNGSEGKLPTGLNMVTNPQGLVPMTPPVTAACTGCHMAKSATAHAMLNTDPKLGESCDVCHGATADFNVNKVHAQ
jgi:OmcA/MtrC family decaheme c-type cytochrome